MVTLVDFLDVTNEEVNIARHGRVGCLCDLCKKLKKMEDSLIMRLGTFSFPGGLNKRDEMKKKVISG
jgi:hypothetical protein